MRKKKNSPLDDAFSAMGYDNIEQGEEVTNLDSPSVDDLTKEEDPEPVAEPESPVPTSPETVPEPVQDPEAVISYSEPASEPASEEAPATEETSESEESEEDGETEEPTEEENPELSTPGYALKYAMLELSMCSIEDGEDYFDVRIKFEVCKMRMIDKYPYMPLFICEVLREEDPDVADEAKARGLTRAAVSMEKTAADGEDYIYAIGNAPTALITLYDLVREGRIRPKLIIGVPVGFVNVVESKEEIIEVCKAAGVPAIVARGRKGGSNVAASICNAILYMATDHVDPASRKWL